ncbi:hypothetical protein BDD12DRAFT_809575 [Trichophaea hybrida]|nr:hypothetical protein BDD12DRAFT_809575 [Trichophaea hybrida]
MSTQLSTIPAPEKSSQSPPSVDAAYLSISSHDEKDSMTASPREDDSPRDLPSPPFENDFSASSDSFSPMSDASSSLSPVPQSPTASPEDSGAILNDSNMPLEVLRESNPTSTSPSNSPSPHSQNAPPQTPLVHPASHELVPLTQDQLSETAWLVDFVNRHYGPEEVKDWEMITTAFNKHFRTSKSRRGVIATYSNIKRFGKPKGEWKSKRPTRTVTDENTNVGRRSKRLRHDNEHTPADKATLPSEHNIGANLQLGEGNKEAPAQESTNAKEARIAAKSRAKAIVTPIAPNPLNKDARTKAQEAASIKTHWVPTGEPGNNDTEESTYGWDSKAAQAAWIFDYVKANFGDNKINWDAVTTAFNHHFNRRKAQSGVRVTYYNVVRAKTHPNGNGKRTATRKPQSMNELTTTTNDQNLIASAASAKQKGGGQVRFLEANKVEDVLMINTSFPRVVENTGGFTAINQLDRQSGPTLAPSGVSQTDVRPIIYAGPHVPPSDQPIKPEVAWILDYVDSRYGPDEPKDWKTVTEEFNRHFYPKKNQSGVRVTYTNIMRGGMPNKKRRGGGIGPVGRSPLKRAKTSAINQSNLEDNNMASLLGNEAENSVVNRDIQEDALNTPTLEKEGESSVINNDIQNVASMALPVVKEAESSVVNKDIQEDIIMASSLGNETGSLTVTQGISETNVQSSVEKEVEGKEI